MTPKRNPGVPDAAPPASTGDIVGVVLAGGLSRRMGAHKPSLRLYGEERPDLLTRTVGLLRGVCGEVWVSCRKGQHIPGCRCIYDEEENLGPIGGILAVLGALPPGRAALVLSCDLPFMDAPTLLRLLRARAANPDPRRLMTTFLQEETGYIEALVAVYEQGALPFFQQAAAAGTRQINLVLDPEQRRDVPYARNEALPFFNVNYPADLETARRLIAALGPQASAMK